MIAFSEPYPGLGKHEAKNLPHFYTDTNPVLKRDASYFKVSKSFCRK